MSQPRWWAGLTQYSDMGKVTVPLKMTSVQSPSRCGWPYASRANACLGSGQP